MSIIRQRFFLFAAIFLWMAGNLQAVDQQTDLPLFDKAPQNDTICAGEVAVFFYHSSSPRAVGSWEYSPLDSEYWIAVEHLEGFRVDGIRLEIHEPGLMEKYQFRALLRDRFDPSYLLISEPVRAFTIDAIQVSISVNGIDLNDQVAVFCAGTPADFWYSPLAAEDNAENDGFVKWQWEFGDGNISFKPDPTHYYQTSGEINVSLAVFDRFGCQSTASGKLLYSGFDKQLQVVGPKIVCGNQIITYEVASDCNDCNYTWYVPGGYQSLETSSDGRSITVKWAPILPASQLIISVEEFDPGLDCVIGEGSISVLHSGKVAPSAGKFTLTEKDGILICLSDDPELFHYRWGISLGGGLDETIISEGEKPFHDFGNIQAGQNKYWVDVRFKGAEACYSRVEFN